MILNLDKIRDKKKGQQLISRGDKSGFIFHSRSLEAYLLHPNSSPGINADHPGKEASEIGTQINLR